MIKLVTLYFFGPLSHLLRLIYRLDVEKVDFSVSFAF